MVVDCVRFCRHGDFRFLERFPLSVCVLWAPCKQTQMHVSIQFWDGQHHTATVPLPRIQLSDGAAHVQSLALHSRDWKETGTSCLTRSTLSVLRPPYPAIFPLHVSLLISQLEWTSVRRLSVGSEKKPQGSPGEDCMGPEMHSLGRFLWNVEYRPGKWAFTATWMAVLDSNSGNGCCGIWC